MEARSSGELNRAFSESAKAKFWSLQVSENADRSPRRSLHSPDRRKPGAVVVMRTMAEVEPEDVNARFK